MTVSLIVAQLSTSEDAFINIFQYSLVGCGFIAACGFIVVLVKLRNLEKSMETLRQKGLAKYKYMFNSIQESIMVLTDENISFSNS